MKIKFGIILLFLSLSGCGLFGNNPTSVVGKFLRLSEKRENVEAMEKLFSERAKRELGAEKILVDIFSAVDIGTKIAAIGENTPFLKPKETINGDFATVTFYTNPGFAEKNDKENQAEVLLIKENGEWKIYAFGQSGEPKPEQNSIFAPELKKAYQIQPELMNSRLTGKTIVVEGGVYDFGFPEEDDSGSVSISTSYTDPRDGFILCKLKTGANALLDKNEKTKIQKLKVKGTVLPKDSSNPVSAYAIAVLDNCTVQ